MSMEEDLLVFLLLNTLLYVLVLAYLARRRADEGASDQSDASAVPTPARDRSTGPGRRRVDSNPSSKVGCPSCGAINDAAYRFCKNCVSDLQSTRPDAVVGRGSAGGS